MRSSSATPNHAFIDDTWKVTPKLTLSLGLRYELTPPFTNTLGDYFTVEIPKITFDCERSRNPIGRSSSGRAHCTDPYAGPEHPLDQHQSGLRRRL